MIDSKLLELICTERPSFHQGETEIDRAFAPEDSYLSGQALAATRTSERTCYAVNPEVLSFLIETVQPNNRTLETGAGCSTLAFGLKQSQHVAITPSATEIDLIKDYAARKHISLNNVHFVRQGSDEYLPRCDVKDLDLVLLDGKHAFPWPILDWFYTADKLRKNGLMILDDAQIRSIGVLIEFLYMDPRWHLVCEFSAKTYVFRKLADTVHDVAWHMQPFCMTRNGRSKLNNLKRIGSKLKHLLHG
jgi:predicted O-methyltransferase YrrM